jgi:hypothetical protein
MDKSVARRQGEAVTWLPESDVFSISLLYFNPIEPRIGKDVTSHHCVTHT